MSRRRLSRSFVVLLAGLITLVASCGPDSGEEAFLEQLGMLFGVDVGEYYATEERTIPIRVYGFKPGSTIELTAVGLPQGVSYSFTNQLTEKDTLKANFNVSVAANADIGDFSYRVRAKSSAGKVDSILRSLRVVRPFTFVLSPAASTSFQGRTTNAHIDIVRAARFTQPITFTNPGLPAGWNVTYTQNPTSTNSADAIIAPPNNVAASLHTIGFVGNFNSYTSLASNYALTLSNADYGVSTAPSTLNILQGANAISTVTIDRSGIGGWQNAIDFSYESPNAGITAAFSSPSTTGNSNTVTISVTGAVPAATYTTNIVSRAGALADKRTSLSVVVADAPRISFGFTSSTLSVIRGRTVDGSITAMRFGGFSMPITFSTAGATGVSATFNPNPMSGSTSTATFATTAAATVGTTPITVTATGPGVANTTAQVMLNVMQEQFTALTPNLNFTVAGGSSIAPVVTIDRALGYTGPVATSFSATHPNITGTFNPSSIVGSTSVLTMNVLAGTPAATYQATANFTGTGGATARSLTFNLTVPSTVNASLKFCTLGLDWFAYRDGTTGAFTRVLPNIDNSFSFQLSQGLGGVAYSWQAGGRRFVNTDYYTSGEFQERSNGCYDRNAEGLKLNDGSATGLTTGTEVYGVLGNATSTAIFGSANWSFLKVAGGDVPLLGTWRNVGSLIPLRFLYRANNNFTNGTNMAAIDVNGAESSLPAVGSVTMDGLTMGANVALLTWVHNQNNTSAPYWYDTPSASLTRNYYGLQTSSLQSNDLQVLGATSTSGGTTREVDRYYRTAGMKSFTFAPTQTLPAPTFLNFIPYPRASVNFTAAAAYNHSASVKYEQATPSQRTWSITKSLAYNVSTNYTLNIEDFSGVTGFNNLWAMNPGFSNYTYTVTGATNTGANGSWIDGTSVVRLKINATHNF